MRRRHFVSFIHDGHADTLSAIADSTFRAIVGQLASTARLVARLAVGYGPIVVAWAIAGNLARYILIQFAGWLAAWNAIAGLAIMPFVILATLVSMVATLLSLRDGMPQLSAIAPVPDRAVERRREFTDAVLAGILPFFAFYVGTGNLRIDMSKYYLRLTEVLAARGQVFGPTAGVLTLTWFTGAVLVITFVLRRVAKRFEGRRSRLLPVIAVYLEAVWVFLSIWVIRDVIDGVVSWVSTRQGIVWIDGIRDAIAARAAPFDWFLEFGGWLIGEFSGLVLQPIGWLTIAGVIYGQAIQPPSADGSLVAERLRLDSRLARARQRLGGVPGWLQRRLRDLWDDLVDRVRPIGDVLKLMWHVGPVVIAGYVLMFYGADWLVAVLNRVIAAAFGPHPVEFWRLYDEAIFLIAPVLLAPLGFGVIAAGYDIVLANFVSTRTHRRGASPSSPLVVQTANETIADASNASNSGSDGMWAPPVINRQRSG